MSGQRATTSISAISRTAGSLFLGAETPFGPVYLAAGLASGGERAFYLFLGKTF